MVVLSQSVQHEHLFGSIPAPRRAEMLVRSLLVKSIKRQARDVMDTSAPLMTSQL